MNMNNKECANRTRVAAKRRLAHRLESVLLTPRIFAVRDDFRRLGDEQTTKYDRLFHKKRQTTAGTAMRQKVCGERRAVLLFLMASTLLVGAGPNQLTPEEKKEGYTLLFNGKNLDGWDGDPVRWSVQDGVIVGSSDGHPFKVNTFLIHKGTFQNFILKGDIKLRNHNSGIQFRSEQLPGEGWMVRGYQADASEVGDEKSAWGNLYEERLRGRNAMKTPDEGWLIARPLLHRGDWNSYEILADGDHIRLTFNGKVTIDMHDKASADGIIALQLHAGPEMRVEFRNLKIKKLP
jgi:hypothetical protein